MPHSSHLASHEAKYILNLIRVVPDFPKPGIEFLDLGPMLADPMALSTCLKAMVAPWGEADITHVVGLESRGLGFAMAMAMALGTGFVAVRKGSADMATTKTPPPVARLAYALEYGEAVFEIAGDAFETGDRVVIVDDVLATGGTAEAAAKLARHQGALVVGFQFLITIGKLDGMSRIANGPSVETSSLLTL